MQAKFAKEISEYLNISKETVRAVQKAMSVLLNQHLLNGEGVQLFTGIKIETAFVAERDVTLPTGEIVTVKDHYNIKPVLSKRLRKLLRKGELFKDYDYDGTWKDNRKKKEEEFPDV